MQRIYDQRASGRIPFMMLFERLPVIGGKHPLDVRFLVQNLSSQLVIGNYAVVTVVLQSASAHFQPCRHLPVRQEAFAAQCRTAVCHEVLNTVQQTVKAVAELGDKRMVLGNHLTHAIADLGLFSTGLTMRITSSGR